MTTNIPKLTAPTPVSSIMLMHLPNLESHILYWAQERGILEHGSITGQTLKTISEIGEFSEAVLGDNLDGILDAIGDIGVCVTILSHMLGSSLTELRAEARPRTLRSIETAALKLCYLAGFLAEDITRGDRAHARIHLTQILEVLLGIGTDSDSPILDADFAGCLCDAYEIISKRTGSMCAGGTFIKDEA
jgi:hypothetical protein